MKAPIGQRLLIVQITRGDSLWFRGILEPRVGDTCVRDTVFRFVITVVCRRVTLSDWWVTITILPWQCSLIFLRSQHSHDVLILEG